MYVSLRERKKENVCLSKGKKKKERVCECELKGEKEIENVCVGGEFMGECVCA